MAHYTPVEDLSVPDFQADVVEDDDGFRILRVSRTDLMPVRIWQQAYDAGVAMIVAQNLVLSAEDFLAHRVEHLASMSFDPRGWVDLGIEDPGYRDYLSRQVAEEQKDPLETTRFIHLHNHTEYSQLDGLTKMEEVVLTLAEDPEGGGAFGTADHGNCAGHPEQQDLCDKHGLKPIFGMEAYFVPDRHRQTQTWWELDGVRVDPEHLTDTEKKKAEKKNDSVEHKASYTHLTLWAMTQQGLRNLWAISTEGYRDGLFDGKPRIDWDTLERLNEGIICGTGCLRGPVSRPLLNGDVEVARENLMRLHQIFDDRLYIEIHTNALEEQVKVNHQLEDFSAAYHIPPLAAVDSHYSIPDHKVVHKAWLAMQTGKTLTEDTSLFQGDQDYHLKTAAEVRESLAYLPEDFIVEAMANTVEVARRCEAKVGGEITTPTYSKASKEHPDPVARDIERLIDICLANWGRKVVGKRHSEADYQARFEREIKLLIEKGFCGYFLIVWDYVAWAKQQGCLVGPGRGSGGGSLVAYLADIVEIDPVDSDLIFERFLTEGRKSLPDFDIDFPASWKSRVLGYITHRWGEDRVATIGTVGRLRSKQAINDVVRVLGPILPYTVDFRAMESLKALVTAADAPLAGKHLPWDEFCAQYADLVDPLIEAYPEVFAMVDVVMDRVKSYGRHAAGVVISTAGPLTDLPMRKIVDSKTKVETMVTQFDMVALEILGYVKFDILTLRTLDTLQECVDLIEAKLGVKINPYDWTTEYDDPQVWSEMSEGKTLGVFQIETASGTRLTKRLAPANLFDLAAVMTVVRPGPMRSGLTESYLRRRAGLEPITYLDPRLEDFLSTTYGSMIYQEQVMATCMNLAGYDSTEADGVRKLLGKKQVEKVAAAGEEFVRRAVECGTDKEVAETLWAQMAEFAKYGFNKAHAFAYAVIGQWCAWLRFHFPHEFLVAALSTVDADRIPDFIEEARRCGYGIVPPDVNRSKAVFTAEGTDVVYGLSEVKGIGGPTADQIVSMAPYSSLDDFIERCVSFSGSAVNMGHVRTLVEVGAFDSIVDNRRAVEMELERQSSGEAKRCMFKIEFPNPEHPFNLPCGFDWADEVDPPMIRKRVDGKMTNVPKPPPKKCTVACRQYRKPPPVTAADVEPYTNDEISRRERELLGVWITHSPFEVIPADVLANPTYSTAQVIEEAPAGGEDHVAVALIEEIKKRKDKNGSDYAFVKMNIQDGLIEAICFASVWEEVGRYIAKDRIGGAVIRKNPRGYQLVDYVPLN